MYAPRLILFDLDGTLVDSVPDLARAANHMLAELGWPAVSEDAVRNRVGEGIGKLVERLLDGPATDPALRERGEAIYRAAYARRLTGHSRIYDGVLDTLESLRARRLTLVCVTNKDTRLARELLAHLDLARFMSWIQGGDECRPKPDPDMLNHALLKFGIAPDQALMVGDSVADIGAARAAGMSVVAVSWGYNHGQGIAGENPDHTIHAMPELLGLLAETV